MELNLPGRAAPVTVLDSVSSTNTLLKEQAMKGAVEGSVLIALHQTGGRGRMGRSFVSPPGGLYLSMLLSPRCTPEASLSLTPCAAVAVQRAIARLSDVQTGIKWPNDLLVDGKKVCGILCESVFYQGQQKLVIGVGLNVNTPPEAFTGELSALAGSLFSLTGKKLSIQKAAEALTEELDRMYADWQSDHRCCLEEYKRSCVNLKRPVLLIRGEEKIKAYAEGIDDNYALMVRHESGEPETIKMGEVSLRNM